MYAKKAGRLLRLVGAVEVEVNSLGLEDVQAYIETRRGEASRDRGPGSR